LRAVIWALGPWLQGLGGRALLPVASGAGRGKGSALRRAFYGVLGHLYASARMELSRMAEQLRLSNTFAQASTRTGGLRHMAGLRSRWK
jgi:hypothetical protein